ncbi:hypothetical protein C804_05404 [Lachnospiraceae bacterium A4]|nr:hypothetical protein C804_05404 [Lachnospiraceae bacterium A4]
MSMALRILLFVASVLTCTYIARKLKKSQIQVMDTVFWIGLAVLFIMLSVFPEIASFLAALIGFQAPVNFIFLLMIFLLLIRCFLLSIRVSQLEDRLKNLVEELAIREKGKAGQQ